jgi:hypothetical protein
MIERHSPSLLTALGVLVGLMGWGLLLWNPKSRKQWFLAFLIFLFVVIYLIFVR